MNLDEERKAFEETQNPIVFERIVYIEKANLYTMKNDFRNDIFTVNKCNELNFGWISWQAAKAHEAEKLKGCMVVPVTPDEGLCEKLEDMASVTPAYAGRYIYKVSIGELNYHWECGLIGIEEAAREEND